MTFQFRFFHIPKVLVQSKKIGLARNHFETAKGEDIIFSTWISYLQRTLVYNQYRADFGHVDGWAIFVPWHHHIMFNPFNNPIIRSILPPLSAYNSLFWAYAFTCFDDNYIKFFILKRKAVMTYNNCSFTFLFIILLQTTVFYVLIIHCIQNSILDPI